MTVNDEANDDKDDSGDVDYNGNDMIKILVTMTTTSTFTPTMTS